jgi:predicted  nucleic acid-binding Zn-ribbon protein
MIRFVCINCGQKFKTADEFAGQASQCPGCGTIVQIPIPEQEPPAPAAAQAVPEPVQSEPPVKQNILNFRPALGKTAAAPEPEVRIFNPDPVPEPEAAAPKLKIKQDGLIVPQAAIKPQPLMKPPATTIKQAFPVGFNSAKPKLPPGLRLVEEDEG